MENFFIYNNMNQTDEQVALEFYRHRPPVMAETAFSFWIAETEEYYYANGSPAGFLKMCNTGKGLE